MRNQWKYLTALLLVVATLCALTAPVLAASPTTPDSPQSSAYITAVYASGSRGSTSASIYFSITATKRMSSLGATTIALYKSNGTYVAQKTYGSYPNMMGYNKTFHSDTETFYSLASGKYYAVVYFKAANSSGYDTSVYTTSYFYVG